MLIMVCKLLSGPILLGSLLSIWLAVQASAREQKGKSIPRGLERAFGSILMSAEAKGKDRWKDGKPRKPLLSHLDVARIINGPLVICLCLAWVWPAIDSPERLMGAFILTMLSYLLVSGLGSILSFLILVRLGFARASGEDGGGGERSLYHPDNYPPGGDGLDLPRVWVSGGVSKINR